MAAGEHGCHSATISPEVLNELAKLEYDGTQQPGEGKPKPANVYAGYKTPERLLKVSKIDPLQAADIDGKLASTDIDYLANNGEAAKGDQGGPYHFAEARRCSDSVHRRIVGEQGED
jgi:transaldolase